MENKITQKYAVLCATGSHYELAAIFPRRSDADTWLISKNTKYVVVNITISRTSEGAVVSYFGDDVKNMPQSLLGEML